MLNRALCAAVAAVPLLMLGSLPASAMPMILAGAPTTIVPTYLSDGTYPYGFPPLTLGPDQFLLPVEITGADKLQTFQFDVTFDNTVVQEVDPLDGTAGIYGAEFTPGDPTSLSFILGGFPFNALGLVDDVAGSYPFLPDGPSGDGVLAYILFEFLQQGDPGFGIDDPTVTEQVPEPATLALLGGGLLGFLGARRRRRSEERHRF